MPQMVDPNALAVLQRMPGISNVANRGGSFLAKRRNDILSGDDALLPDGDSADMKIAQAEIGDQHGIGVSRDEIRDDLLSKVRKWKAEQDAELTQKTAPEIIRGQFGVESAERAAKAQADRLAYTQDQINNRSEMNHREVMARLDKNIDARGALQEDRQQFEVDNPNTSAAAVPAALYKALQDAETNMPGNPITRFLRGDAANRQLDSALEAILDRQGVLDDLQNDLATLQKFQGTLDERISQAGANPASLSPYERKWLERKLGAQ